VRGAFIGVQVPFVLGGFVACFDRASRVDAIQDGAQTLAEYQYLGLGSVVEVDYHEPDVRYTPVGTAGGNEPDTGDIYRGLDRFGRVKDSYWRDYGSSVDVDRIKYGYDRAGNRIWREKRRRRGAVEAVR
jgi:hypothetical protein